MRDSTVAFLKETLHDNGKGSFGRLYALPFLLSAWALSTLNGGIALYKNLKHGQSISVIDDVMALAGIGFALFTGSKMISMRGKDTSTGVGGPAPELTKMKALSADEEQDPKDAA